MIAPISNLKKDDIIWLSKHKCKHSHTFLEHYNCFLTENPPTAPFKERICYLDIETEDLKADFGIMFCWCILDEETKKIKHDIINKDDIKKYSSHERDTMPREDSRIIRSLVKELENYDRVIGHYSSRFDLPFCRTRSVICDIPFIRFGELWEKDTWRILYKKFALRGNSLKNGCAKLLGYSRKDSLSLSIKHGCLRGEDWALKDVLEHCKKDVLDTRDLYIKIEPYYSNARTKV